MPSIIGTTARVGETLTPVEVTVVDSQVDLVEDIQRRPKKQDNYRESCSAVAGSNTVRATTVLKSMLFPVARQSMINDDDIITNERTNDDQNPTLLPFIDILWRTMTII